MGGKVISAIIAFWKAKGCSVSTARDTELMWDTNMVGPVFCFVFSPRIGCCISNFW